MRSPYRITGPACISFSGGRTSGFMLAQILDAHDGALPADVHVLFANTGKERPETLDFVRDCGERWGVKITWLEYAGRTTDPSSAPLRQRGGRVLTRRIRRSRAAAGDERYGTVATAEVTHETASRAGEPFAALIGARRYLPNPVTRFCTEELKLKRIRDWMDATCGRSWDNVVGLRADEPRRVARIRGQRSRWGVQLPLDEAGATVDDVMTFWSTQSFDLRLQSHEGNCDLCFLKSAGKLLHILETRPDLADWWIAQEHRGLGAKSGLFRNDRPPYERLVRAAGSQLRLPLLADDTLPCGCTD